MADCKYYVINHRFQNMLLHATFDTFKSHSKGAFIIYLEVGV